MAETRVTRTPRARRLLSAAMAALLALGGGTALVLATAQSASAAPGDVTIELAENTPIPHSPFMFDGLATAGDAITVSSGAGPDCHAVTNGLGVWQCNMFFTSSTDVTVVTAVRDVDDLDGATQESEGQEYPIALPVSVTENQPGQILTNSPVGPITGSGAWPTATMTVLVGGNPATCGAANGSGNWSCVPPPLADGTYPISARQDVGGAISDATASSFTLDTTTFIPRFDVPFDSTLPPGSAATSDDTPTVGGGAGDAEPGGTVNVYASDFGTTAPVHPVGDPGNFYCTAVADGAGAWSCSGGVLQFDHYWIFGATQQDAAGNSTGSPDDEFDIHILPPPAPPTVIYPTPGAGELFPMLVNGTVDGATTSVRIREGATDLCGAIIPVAGTFSCPGIALAPGAHTIDIISFDTYGTNSATIRNVVSWPQPALDNPLLGYQSSNNVVHLTGDAPIGSDLSVRVDGVPQAGCSGIVAGIPEFDCDSTFQVVGTHTVDVDFLDPNLDPSTTVTRNFDILFPLNTPNVSAPVDGSSTTDKTVHVAMTNEPEGASYVREGATVLCPPVTLVVGSFSCNTIPLSVGVHHLDIAQTDQYGTLSTVEHRTVTILPVPNLPLTMKTFGFSFRVTNPDGSALDPSGLGTGDLVTIEATGVPPGTRLVTEIHSTPIELGSQLVGQTGVMRLTTEVPVVPPGAHDIVVTASGDGYWPATYSQDFEVHGLKQIPETDVEIVKELGDPEPVKELGTPDEAAAGTGAGGPGGSGGNGFEDPSVFGSSVETPFDATAHTFALSPAGLVLSGSIAIAFLLLVGFPAELLESTIRSNYDRAFGWLARLRRRAGRMLAPVARVLSNPWVASGLTILAAAFLLGFADPNFGFNGASVRLMLAMIVAVLAINVGLALIVMRVAGRSFDVAAMLKPMPAALVIVGVSVLVSRLAGISPGFLFGVVLGVAYARELKLRDEARLGLLGVGLTIAAGLIAWLGYGLASAIASGPGFANNLIIEILAAITLEALGTLVIALLPIEFLDGRTIFRWSKLAWIASYAVTLLVFLFVVVPLSDNWGTMSAPVFGWGTLFAVFAAVAIVTWAIFRRRSRRSTSATPSTPEAAAPRQRVRR